MVAAWQFAADVDAAAECGFGPDWIDELARIGFEPGQFSTFHNLDQEARTFVLKVLAGEATDADWAEFKERSDVAVICKWMLTLPAFRKGEALDELDEW